MMFDSCVLIDTLESGRWSRWSDERLVEASVAGGPAINHIVFAELCANRLGPGPALRIVETLQLRILPLTDPVAIRAGQAHRLYRSRRGGRSAILADFLIGAHAATLGIPLVTRDRARFSSYFPELTLIAPESDQP